ncbi:MAG TPA: hypothetical protein VFF06_14965 [Polyangia bacterium]|nr:hypothetical protein [Polyangia bacterium]
MRERIGRSAMVAVLLLLGVHATARAQSPELALREFASGQIKKGVRSIGFGGDGATWGNYSLVWRDAGTALVDAGATGYTNGNLFSFTTVGFTTPQLWRGLTIYAIALSQSANTIHLALSSPGLGPVPIAVRGDGSNQALFIKLAMPLGHGFAIGVLLSYEVSQFDATTEEGAPAAVRFRTQWLPSGGLGVSWQPTPRWLAGVRVILNHDWERRVDPTTSASGLYRSYEFRAGASFSPWKGALLDAGGTLLERANAIAGTETLGGGLNLGFEQAFLERQLVVRGGVDECTFGAWGRHGCTAGGGLSVKVHPVNLDVAYLYNLGAERVGPVFGSESHSILATLTLDYLWIVKRALAAQAAKKAHE